MPIARPLSQVRLTFNDFLIDPAPITPLILVATLAVLHVILIECSIDHALSGDKRVPPAASRKPPTASRAGTDRKNHPLPALGRCFGDSTGLPVPAHDHLGLAPPEPLCGTQTILRERNELLLAARGVRILGPALHVGTV